MGDGAVTRLVGVKNGTWEQLEEGQFQVKDCKLSCVNTQE